MDGRRAPDTRYNRSRSGWFDGCTFTDWFKSVVIPFAKKCKGRVVVLGDNLSSHFTEEVIRMAHEHNISFVCFPPNTTPLTQPLDVGFYAPLKRKWRHVLDEWKKQEGHKSQTLNKTAFPRLLKELVESCVDQEPQAQEQHADTGIRTRRNMYSKNLVAGFQKTGIYPFNPSEVLARIPSTETTGTDATATSSLVSDVVVNMLQDLRGWNKPAPTRKRTRVDVVPGRSISLNDLQASRTGSDTPTAGDEVDSIFADTSEESSDSEEGSDIGTSDTSSDNDDGSTDTVNMSDVEVLPVPVPLTITDPQDSNPVVDHQLLQIGSYVIVSFPVQTGTGTSANADKPCETRNRYYVCRITITVGNRLAYGVECLRKRGDRFVAPNVRDLANIEGSQIICVLPRPVTERRGVKFSTNVINHYSLE